MIKNQKGVEVIALTNIKDLEISNIHNEKWLTNKISHPRTQRPGLAIAGYPKYINKSRLQIFGKTEVGYISQLSPSNKMRQLRDFFSQKLPAIIVAENQEVEPEIINAANKYKTPILVSGLRASLLVPRVTTILYTTFSKKVRINGVLMDIMGMGTLITGDSGIGKSETALELVNKGHSLVSDDLIEFYLNSNDEPVGRSIEKIKRWIEVRGLGIINIVDIFGVGALLDEKRLDLVINLEKWSAKKRYDRLGEESLFFSVLGKDIPMFDLPVAPGRNLSTLIEVAVKYFISRKNGSESFMEHIYRKGS